MGALECLSVLNLVSTMMARRALQPPPTDTSSNLNEGGAKARVGIKDIKGRGWYREKL